MPTPRRRLGLTALTLLGLALPASAQAAPVARVADAQVTLQRGATAEIAVQVDAVPSCTLRIRRRSATVATQGASSVTFRFRVARRTGARRARATVSCAPAVAQSIRLRVARTGHRPAHPVRRLVAGRIHGAAGSGDPSAATGTDAPAGAAGPGRPVHGPIGPAGPPPGVPMSPEESSAYSRAQALWSEHAEEHDDLWRSGECTDWADRKRPEIVERVTVAKWTAELLGRPTPVIRWGGGHWDETAAAYGLPTGTVPRAGALVTWDPGVGGSGEVGHIGYVESVGEDTFTVSEMHAPELGVVTERRVPIDSIADGGVAFVY